MLISDVCLSLLLSASVYAAAVILLLSVYVQRCDSKSLNCTFNCSLDMDLYLYVLHKLRIDQPQKLSILEDNRRGYTLGYATGMGTAAGGPLPIKAP
jgi:hypothetical protein